MHLSRRNGLTLVELVIVMFILIALAGLLVPLLGTVQSDAQMTTTQASMVSLRNAILAYHQDMKGIQVGAGLIPGTTGIPTTLKDLQIQPAGTPSFDPIARRGWRGPYLQQTTGTFPSSNTTLESSFYPSGNLYGQPGDPVFLDGWGNPIVLQWPQTSDPVSTQAQYVRLVSAGPPTLVKGNKVYSTIDTVATVLMPTQPIPGQPTLASQRGNDLVMFILTQDQYP